MSECEWGKGRERVRHRIPKQDPGSELSAQSPMQVSSPETVRSGPELKSDIQLKNFFREECLT